MKLTNISKILILLLCAATFTEAIRGNNGARKIVVDSIEDLDSRYLSQTFVRGAKKNGDEKIGETEEDEVVQIGYAGSQDDPEEQLALNGGSSTSTGNMAKGQSKQGETSTGFGTQEAAAGTVNEVGDEDMVEPSEEEGDSEESVYAPNRKGNKGKSKSNKSGKSKGGGESKGTSAPDEDTPPPTEEAKTPPPTEDEETPEPQEVQFDSEDIYMNPDDPGMGGEPETGDEPGDTNDQLEEPDTPPSDNETPSDNGPLAGFPPGPLNPYTNSATMERESPKITMKFDVTNRNQPASDDGDYNELAIVTGMYLDEYFGRLFDATPAHHAYTTARLQKTVDPFIVDFQVGSSFVIPGDVPTIPFLYERIKQAFEGSNGFNYLAQLSNMDSNNPFTSTVDVQIITKATGINSNGGSNGSSSQSSLVTKKSVMIPFLAGVGFLVLVIIGFFWVRRRRNNSREVDNLSMDGYDQSKLVKPDVESGYSTGPYRTQVYAPDDETLQYLNAVRQKYSQQDLDVRSSKSTDEELSADDEDEDEEMSQENLPFTPNGRTAPEEQTISSFGTETMAQEGFSRVSGGNSTTEADAASTATDNAMQSAQDTESQGAECSIENENVAEDTASQVDYLSMASSPQDNDDDDDEDDLLIS